jgi:uncharacterized protein
MTQHCTRITVHVQPRASKTEVVGEHGDAIKIRLAAPPVDNAANQALIEFLAETLDLPKRNVRIAGGASSRRKSVDIDGMTLPQIRLKLL